MELSPQQAVAYDKCAVWLEACKANRGATLKEKPFFKIFGYAGTGKSTIANKLTEAIPNKLAATFTGKAASVLQRKGVNASTIHSLVYKPVPVNETKLREMYKKRESLKGSDLAELNTKIKEELKPKFTLNDDSALHECDLLLVDEVSMVGEEIGRDLLSFKVPILVLGDPGQLPPLSGEGFFTKGEPDALLTEIHRQAAGNPIIAMATQARQGKRLALGKRGDSEVIWKNTFDPARLSSFDQVICGRNATRKASNSRVRDSLGYISAVPQAGEKIICLKNNKEVGILNGTQWKVIEAADCGKYFALEIVPWDDQDAKPLILDSHPFDVEAPNLPWWERKIFEEFDFGYAITCHKSQGSQWGSVLVQDESYCFKDDRYKWLYTALTRAENKVTVVI